MTISKVSNWDLEPVTSHYEQVLRSCRERSEWFDQMFLGIGERQDSVRKALYIASHWAHVVEYLATGKTNSDLLAFRDHLLWMSKSNFSSLMSKIHDWFEQEFLSGRGSQDFVQFAVDLFHTSASPTLEVYKIIYQARP